MDDLISREALLKAIALYEEKYKDKLKGVAYIKFLIRDMPTVEAEPVDRWISVKDRLPDKSQRVFVFYKK